MSSAGYSEWAINSLGMYLTSIEPEKANPNVWLVQASLPTLIQHNGPAITSTGWTRISGTFQAAGGEKFITIGNFKDDNQTLSGRVSSGRQPYSPGTGNAYYYIDNVALYEIPYAGENIISCAAGSSVTLGSGPELPGANYQWLINGVQIQPNGNMLNPVVSPSQTTTYTLIVRKNGSIISTSYVTVTVLPQANAGPDFTVCGGVPIVLSSGQPVGGVWSGPGVTFANGVYTFRPPTNTAANYTLTYTAFAGCSGDNLIATVVPGNIPEVNINAHYTACVRPTPPNASITNSQAGHTYNMHLTDVRGNVLATGPVSNPSFFGLPLTGPGDYILIITDNQTPAPCNITTLNFTTTGVKWLGTAGQVTTIDASQFGGTVNYSGEYLVKGPLELINGTFNFLPGTVVQVEPAAGVPASNLGIYAFAPYLTQNGGATHPTIIKAGTGAKLFLSGSTMTAFQCYSYEKWGGLHLTDGAQIYTSSGADPNNPGQSLQTVISQAYVGVGSSELSGTQHTVNNNLYSFQNTTFQDNVYGFWDLNKENPAVTGEGIVECLFKNNETGVYLQDDPVGVAILLGGDYSAAVYKGNTFTDNQIGFRAMANKMNLVQNTFTGNSLWGIWFSAQATQNYTSNIQNNTINVPDGRGGIQAGFNLNITGNTITGTVNRAGSIGIKVVEPDGAITGNTLQDLETGIAVGNLIYNLLIIEKNTFTDNLTGIKFISPAYINNPTGGTLPPKVACNTFSATRIASTITTRGIHLEPGVSMINPSLITASRQNRLGEILAPSGNKFINITEQLRNDGAALLTYHKFNAANDEINLTQIYGFTGGTIPPPNQLADGQDACGGGTNPGVNSRMAGVGSTATKENNSVLGHCFPNPATTETIIPFTLADNCHTASLVVRQIISGRVIQTIELKPAQKQGSVSLDLQKFKVGLYAYTLVVDNKPVATKMLEVKK